MSATLDVKSMDGSVTGTVQLDDQIFGVQLNVPVLHQVVTAQLAAARAGTQSTKTRAEVSGGGAKPFRQKGTGRARQGSTRAPHYSGGGIALGPKPRKYRQRTPRKMVRLALHGALSDRATAGRVAVVEEWSFEIPNTKAARAALAALGVDGRVLVVLSRDEHNAYKSLRNLPDIDLIFVSELAAYDVLCSDWLVFSRRALPGDNTWGEAQTSAPAPRAKAAKTPSKAVAKPAKAAPAKAAPAKATPTKSAAAKAAAQTTASEEAASEEAPVKAAAKPPAEPAAADEGEEG